MWYLQIDGFSFLGNGLCPLSQVVGAEGEQSILSLFVEELAEGGSHGGDVTLGHPHHGTDQCEARELGTGSGCERVQDAAV